MLESYEDVLDTPFRVSDFKQWIYCPRILYFTVCLPDVRPTTFMMEAGREAGKSEEGREIRRSLRSYGLAQGRREFNVPLRSERLGLRGVVDMVIWVDEPPPGEVIPVDYKLSRIPGEHFKLQLMAYGLMLEEASGMPARRGFLYEIPLRRTEEVRFTLALRQKLLRMLEAMHHMLWTEQIPDPAPQRRKCLSCEFRRFCNDVL